MWSKSFSSQSVQNTLKKSPASVQQRLKALMISEAVRVFRPKDKDIPKTSDRDCITKSYVDMNLPQGALLMNKKESILFTVTIPDRYCGVTVTIRSADRY